MKLSVIVIAASLLGALAVQAQETPSAEHLAHRAATHKACATEEKSLCEGKQGREIFQCLREHDDKLGSGCRDALAKLASQAKSPAK